MTPRGRTAAVFCAALAFYAFGTGEAPLFDRDEPRFAQSSREMGGRGGWVVPHFDGAPRYDKPPLVYWAQAAAYRAFGSGDFAARLPSAAAAAATVALVFAFGLRLYGPGAALGAALAFGLAVQTLALAKAATADALMGVFFVSACLAAWELLTEPPRMRRRAVLHGSVALGFLAKGPVALLPLAAALAFARWQRVPSAARRLALWPGLAAAAAVVALWAVPAWMRTGGEFAEVGLGRHVFARGLRPLEGHGGSGLLYLAALPFYFAAVFATFFPASLVLVPALRRFARAAERGPAEKFLLCAAAAVFAAFTPLATKLPHYIYPALPFLALLAARHAELAGRGQALRRAAAAFAAAAVGAAAVLFPLAGPLQPSRELYGKSRHLLSPDMEFATFDYNEPSLVWYFRCDVRGGHETPGGEGLEAFMARPGPRFCVLSEEKAAEFLPRPDAGWAAVRVRGLNLAKGRFVRLVLYAKGPER